jgi:hypothetical protein
MIRWCDIQAFNLDLPYIGACSTSSFSNVQITNGSDVQFTVFLYNSDLEPVTGYDYVHLGLEGIASSRAGSLFIWRSVRCHINQGGIYVLCTRFLRTLSYSFAEDNKIPGAYNFSL